MVYNDSENYSEKMVHTNKNIIALTLTYSVTIDSICLYSQLFLLPGKKERNFDSQSLGVGTKWMHMGLMLPFNV